MTAPHQSTVARRTQAQAALIRFRALRLMWRLRIRRFWDQRQRRRH